MRTKLISILALGAFATGPALAEVYSWKDKTGKTNYSDRPPIESQSADKVDGAQSGDKNAKTGKGADQGKADDDPRTRVAREDARRKKEQEAEEKERKLVAWRCTEMEKQRATAQEQYQKLSVNDPKKAAVLKTDIDNYQETMSKMCK